jgi:hypothetical protein
MLVIPDETDDGSVKMPVPDTNDHDPVVPTGIVALMVVEFPQPIPRFVPALAGAPIKTFMDELDDVHVENEMVHVSVFVPTARPVTVVVGLDGFAKMTPAGPVQVPVPMVGVLAAMVTVRMQGQDWSGPATLVVT